MYEAKPARAHVRQQRLSIPAFQDATVLAGLLIVRMHKIVVLRCGFRYGIVSQKQIDEKRYVATRDFDSV
jgi:hypothetical protein